MGRARALVQVRSDEKLLRRLEALYLRDALRDTSALEMAARRGEIQEAKRLAHMLKGTSATIGADEVAAAARAVERELASEGGEGVGFLLARFRREVEAACAALEAAGVTAAE